MRMMTKQQQEALRLFPNGALRSSRRYQKVFSELARKGYLIATRRKRRRVYLITEKGAELNEDR